MRPIIHPFLINDPFGDPGVYVEFLYEKRALLFDLGDLHCLPPSKLLRISHVFVSHAHMDHFCGFDQLLRVSLGRDKSLHIYGPQGLIQQVGHKLAAYTWNLVCNYTTDFTLIVAELHSSGASKWGTFRCRSGFRLEDSRSSDVSGGVLLNDQHFLVRASILDHGTPCLAFSLEEKCHVNIWKSRLDALGFRVGPWLREFKSAIWRGDPNDRPFRVWWRSDGQVHEELLPLGTLKAEIAEIVPGQKVAYVTDVRYSPDNSRKIIDLAEGADILFIEAPFLDADREIAARKNHLTALQAGSLARSAKVRRMVPFHFSPRYSGHAELFTDEASEAFGGRCHTSTAPAA